MNELLLRRRNVVINSTPLPYDAKVEYLQCSGEQYIDTGIVVGEKDKITADARFNTGAQTSYNTICDAISSSGGSIFLRINKNLNCYYVRFGSSTSAQINTSYGGSRHVFVLKKRLFSVNGATMVNPNYSSMPNSSLIIGRIASNTQFVGFIYSFKITNENNVDLLDFIPVRVGSTGYMYDTVSGTLYGNAGTGDFILGPDIN